MTVAYVILGIWTLLWAYLGSFSALGTACNTCDDQIERGTWIIWISLGMIYATTVWLSHRMNRSLKQFLLVAGTAIVVPVAMFAIALIVMPI